MDELITYLDAINDYNQTFETCLSNELVIDEISKKYIASENELLNNIYGIKNEEDKHNAVLIELKGFEIPLKNFIVNHMYSGICSFINDNIKNKCDRKKVFKRLGISESIYDFDNRIQNLENIHSYYNEVSNNFYDMLVNYSGIPKKTFYIKSEPNFYYSLFYEEIIFEYEDKYILLGFYIDD